MIGQFIIAKYFYILEPLTAKLSSSPALINFCLSLVRKGMSSHPELLFRAAQS
jgi:hypothetical protein